MKEKVLALHKKNISVWGLHIPTLIVGILLSLLLTGVMEVTRRNQYLQKAALEGETKLYQLSRSIDACATAADGMAGVVGALDGQVDDFKTMAQRVAAADKSIVSVHLAPKGKVAYRYPEDRTEYDGLKIPTNLMAPGQRAIIGPTEAADGSKGFTLVQPIFTATEFWGYSLVTLDLDKLLDTANFDSIRRFGYNYRLMVNSPEGDVPVSSFERYTTTSGEVLSSAEIGGRFWDMYVQASVTSQDRLVAFLLFFSLLMLSFVVAGMRSHNRKLKLINDTDGLTGIMNRRGLDELVGHLEKDSDVRSLAMVMADIDGFKNFNDRYGHGCGDMLLENLARKLDRLVSSDGVAVRIGGDEFLLVLVNPDAGWKERLREFFSSVHHFVYEGTQYEYRLSAGCAQYPEDDTDIRRLSKKADVALYHAKGSETFSFLSYRPGLSEIPEPKLGLSFRDLADGIPAGVVVTEHDFDGRILYANGECLKMFGCSSLEDFLAHSKGRLVEVMESGERILRKDGRRLGVLVMEREVHHEVYGTIGIILLVEWHGERGR